MGDSWRKWLNLRGHRYIISSIMENNTKLTYYPWYEGATEYVTFLGVRLWRQAKPLVEKSYDPFSHLSEGQQLEIRLHRERYNDDYTRKSEEEIAEFYRKEQEELEKENKPSSLAGWLRMLELEVEMEAPSWVKQTSVPATAKQLGFKVTTRKEGDKLYVTRNN